MRWAAAIGVALAINAAALVMATNFIAGAFDQQPALGAPLISFGGARLYPPWAVLGWTQHWAHAFPKPFAIARLIILIGVVASVLSAALLAQRGFRIKPFGKLAWAKREDLKEAALLSNQGAVLGKFDGDLLAFDGPEHQILIGASRSGKGRGHVIPTLLASPHSALVVDIKGELADGDLRHGFPGTAGFRETLGPVLRFAPTRAESVRFNPMFEIQRGANEVRGAQNLIDVLFAAFEDGPHKDFWLRSAANIAAPVLLHVLYSEPLERKTLTVVREKLRNLSQTAEQMRRTLHRLNPATNRPEVHPEILHAAESFLAGEERMRSGIQATAESMFGVFADPLVAHNTATSDFRLSDLMCLEKPVTLYLQPPASDVSRLMPLMRLIVDLTGRSLMESQTHDAMGREKKHRLTFVLDEFPMWGRLSFFETMMGAMAGYGLKAYLVCQSLNHITRAYGRDNVILDNCHIVTSFSASDGETAKRIAEMAGEVWEVRESETHKKPKAILGFHAGSTTLREERRPLLLPADVRGLPRNEQLIFVAGCKPIRAKKIRFDEERVLAQRLKSSSHQPMTLTTQHDWVDVRPLGYLEAPPSNAVKRGPKASHASAQGDLFAAAKGPKISDLALAGFRNPDGSRRTPEAPEAPDERAPSPSSTARPKSKGI